MLKIKEGYPLNNLVRFYGFKKGFDTNALVSVSSGSRMVDIGRHLHWLKSENYYHMEMSVIINLIKKGIIIKGEENE